MNSSCRESGPAFNRFARSVNGNSGFTIVELIVVTAIIGVLATMVIMGFADFRDKTRVARCVEEVRGLEKDLISYASEKGTFPPTATWLSDIGRSGLKDPWNNDYVYSLTLTRMWAGNPLNTDFDLYSIGADSSCTTPSSLLAADSLDDIVRAGDGSFVGTAKRYQL